MFDLAPALLISRILTLVIALTIHEFSHAFVADRFGDDTPRLMGRLTLNPLKHLDVIGSLLLIVAGFGWAKPVPVNPVALKRHSRSAMMWVSLAGPGSNLLMAIVAAIPLRLHLVPWEASNTFLPSPAEFLFTFFLINLILMIFNLIPISPLDGEKILEFLLPTEWAERYAQLRPYGPILLMLIIFVAPRFGVDIIGSIMNPAINLFKQVLLGV
ncbi:MAG: peptidase M50 family protein [Chloroflexi bacterium]|nr:MAG: peptidase M50 family protein [Chloroflexota bacterium]MBA4375138.1 site-2 protease family protein [Anaerolinea sp.]